MVKEGQEEHTEVEMKILKCASQANLTKDELIMVLKRVGGTTFKDFIDLRAEDFDGCGFLPLLIRRLCCFRSSLSREFWRPQEEDDTACGSCDAVQHHHLQLCYLRIIICVSVTNLQKKSRVVLSIGSSTRSPTLPSPRSLSSGTPTLPARVSTSSDSPPSPPPPPPSP